MIICTPRRFHRPAAHNRFLAAVTLGLATLACASVALGQSFQVYPQGRRGGGPQFEGGQGGGPQFQGRQGGGWVTPAADSYLVELKTFPSRAARSKVSYHVYTPSAYTANPRQRFPVIYWLHGSGSGVKGIPFLAQFFHDAMESGKMPPAIVVFPNGLPDGMWVDSKDGQRPVETMFVSELLPLIDRSYRTIPRREGRVVEGFSMGGYGAGRLGLKYPERFRAVSMYGAGPLQRNFLANDPNLQPMEVRRRIFGKTYGNDAGYFLRSSPWELARARAKNLPADFHLRMVVGEDDKLLDNNLAFHQHLSALGLKHDYLQVPGVGHNPRDILAGSEDEAMAFYRAVLPQS